jgi:anti-sigma factor RsiW
MNNVPQDELLSAYLDGELTAEEQAEVEQLLAANPAARQLLEELRALSSALQAMPAYTLEEDLSGRVLRLAERRMLAGSGESTRDTEPVGTIPAREGPLWRSILRRTVTPRAVLWSGLAVAVAVVLTMAPWEAEQPRMGRIARKTESAAEPREIPTMGPARPAADETALDETALDETAAGEVLRKDQHEMLDAGHTAGRAAPGGTAGLSSRGPEPPREHKAAARKPLVMERKGAEPAGAFANKDDKDAPADGFVRKQRKGGDWIGGRGGAPKQSGGLSYGGSARTGRARQTVAGTMIVLCDVSTGVDYTQAVNDVFARQRIDWQRPVGTNEQREVDKVKQEDVEKEGKSPPARPSRLGRPTPPPPAATADALDLVYVTASPSQIDAAVNDLRRQSRVFASITINPATIRPPMDRGRARQFGQAERGRGQSLVPPPEQQRAEQQRADPAEAEKDDKADVVEEAEKLLAGKLHRRKGKSRGLAQRLRIPPADLARGAAAGMGGGMGGGLPATKKPDRAKKANEEPAMCRVLFVFRVVPADEDED